MAAIFSLAGEKDVGAYVLFIRGQLDNGNCPHGLSDWPHAVSLLYFSVLKVADLRQPLSNECLSVIARKQLSRHLLSCDLRIKLTWYRPTRIVLVFFITAFYKHDKIILD